jgi:hypothetical protein
MINFLHEIHSTPMPSLFIAVVLYLEYTLANTIKSASRIMTFALIEENGMKDAMKTMVVEDNSRARRALTTYISLQAGIKVTAEASNGLEAINLIKDTLRHCPDGHANACHGRSEAIKSSRTGHNQDRYQPCIPIISQACPQERMHLVKGSSVDEIISTIILCPKQMKWVMFINKK